MINDGYIAELDRREGGPTRRRISMLMDAGVILALIGFAFWIGQLHHVIETQGETITTLKTELKELPSDFVATRSIDEYIDRRVQVVFQPVEAELAKLTAEQGRTKAEVRATYELSMQSRVRDLQRQACELPIRSRERGILETEIQDLLNRFNAVTGRDHQPPRCAPNS